MTTVLEQFGPAFLDNRDAMYRIAASILRRVGREHEAEDIVQDAAESILRNPPDEVKNWQAFLIYVTRLRALDRVGSAPVRHADNRELDTEQQNTGTTGDIADDVAEYIDDQRRIVIMRESLAELDPRLRSAVVGSKAYGRIRRELAEEFGVSDTRISQMVREALTKFEQDIICREGQQK